MLAEPVRHSGAMTSILWLRRDLRRRDLPALLAAADDGPVLPVFILDDGLLAESDVRTAGLVRALHGAMDAYDGGLVIRRGDPAAVLPELVRASGATSVHISAEPHPYGRLRDQRVRDALDVPLVATGSPYAVGPGTLTTQQGRPYSVFTPFSRAWRAHGWPTPAPEPRGLRLAAAESLPLPEVPVIDVDLPDVSERAALERWDEFRHRLDDYATARDRADLDGTSRMSVHLKFGTIHPRTLLADLDPERESHGRYLLELGWREFYADVTWHRPESVEQDLRTLPLDYDDPATDPATAALLRAWQEGRTGYPFVDAGMRQLLATGWMHNRVRMVVASFLTKDLHIWWPHGARWFMRHLVDGDPASNSHGWQWVAGTGTDASPYFRVFNPVAQGQRFDPVGDYVRRWVPELRDVPGKGVHEPWNLPGGGVPGYPAPVVDHAEERLEALRRYEAARAAKGGN